MKKAAFIIPYFGTLPDYFSEWKYSASFLKDSIDFIVITDDIKSKMLETVPSNVIIKEMTFEGFREMIQSKFDFPIQLPSPYKICDYRPAYGYLFEDMLKPYDFWGNCDLDQVWGNYRKFITKEVLENHEKIFYLGHFSLHKNSERMRFMFMNDGGMANYKEVFGSPNFYAFDEFAGMVSICKKHSVKTYYKQVYADIAVMQARITLRKLRNYQKQIVYWKAGSIFRSYIDNGKVETEEYLYCHYQKKHPASINADIYRPTAFIIQRDKFIDISNEEITVKLIEKYSDYLNEKKDQRDKRTYYLNKTMSFLKSSYADKKIWMRRKLFAKSL